MNNYQGVNQIMHERKRGPLLKMLISAGLCFFGVGGAGAIEVMGQAPPLPSSLISDFSWGPMAALYSPSSDPAVYDASNLSVGVVFDTEDQTLTMDWRFEALGANYGFRKEEEYSLSYQPTAFCTAATSGEVMFVAGYVKRTGHVIVERWEITNMALGSYASPGGGGVRSTLTKQVEKSVLAMTLNVKPLRSIVYHAPQQKLWLFEEEFPHAVWAVDLVGGDPVWLFDSTTVPELATLYHAQSYTVNSTVPDGGGYVIEFVPWRVWLPNWHGPNTVKGTDEVYIVRDVDFDGVIDESVLTTIWDVGETRDYYHNTIPTYP